MAHKVGCMHICHKLADTFSPGFPALDRFHRLKLSPKGATLSLRKPGAFLPGSPDKTMKYNDFSFILFPLSASRRQSTRFVVCLCVHGASASKGRTRWDDCIVLTNRGRFILCFTEEKSVHRALFVETNYATLAEETRILSRHTTLQALHPHRRNGVPKGYAVLCFSQDFRPVAHKWGKR